MKYLFILLLVPTFSIASINFRSDSNLSSSEKQLIASSIEEKLDDVQKTWKFFESESVKLDNGDFYSRFLVLGTDADGYHPRRFNLLIEVKKNKMEFMHAEYMALAFECIVDRLMQIDSDEYLNITNYQISNLLYEVNDSHHTQVVKIAKECNPL